MSSSNVKPTNFTPKTISEFLAQVSIISNVSDKLVKFDRFITRLEDEMRKLDAFKRELPLSVLLVNDGMSIFFSLLFLILSVFMLFYLLIKI